MTDTMIVFLLGIGFTLVCNLVYLSYSLGQYKNQLIENSKDTAENKKDIDSAFKVLRDHENRITKIETTHKVKGC